MKIEAVVLAGSRTPNGVIESDADVVITGEGVLQLTNHEAVDLVLVVGDGQPPFAAGSTVTITGPADITVKHPA